MDWWLVGWFGGIWAGLVGCWIGWRDVGRVAGMSLEFVGCWRNGGILGGLEE